MDCMSFAVSLALAGSFLPATWTIRGLIPSFVGLVPDLGEYSAAFALLGFWLFPVFSHCDSS